MTKAGGSSDDGGASESGRGWRARGTAEGSGAGAVGSRSYSVQVRETGGTWEAAAGGARRPWGKTRVP